MTVPAFVRREEVHELLVGLVSDIDREMVKTRIRAGGTPLYTSDPGHPGMIVEVRADGTRTRGYFEGRRFVPMPEIPST